MDFFKKILAPLSDYWKKIDKKNKTRIIVLGVLLVAVITVSVILFTRPTYEVLYSNLTAEEAGEVMNALGEMGIDAKLSSASTVMVRREDVNTAFSQLALAGVPSTGLGYDTFSSSTGMGTTDYEKRTYERFDLQDRLQKAMVNYMEGIEAAVVTLNRPDPTKVVFTSQTQPATASVTLRFKAGATMTVDQIDGIVKMVAHSAGIDPENITITDQNANILNGAGSGNSSSVIMSNLDIENRVRLSFETQVRELLRPVFGDNGMTVMVTPTLNFDKKLTESMTFSPVVDDSGIERSIERMQEKAVGYTNSGDVPGTDTNGLAPSYPELTGDGTGEYSNITERINYEIDQVNETIEHAEGTLEDINVAIVLDSNIMTEDFSDDVISLVSTTLGIQPVKVAVSTMPFAEVDSTEFDEYLAEKNRSQMFDFILTLLGYLLAAIAIIVLLVMLMRAIRGEKPEIVTADGELAELQELAALAMGGEDEGGEIVEKISPTKDKIESFIDKSPEAVANLLRNWLSDDRKGMR